MLDEITDLDLEESQKKASELRAEEPVAIRKQTRQLFLWLFAVPIVLALLNFWAASRYQESIAWVSHTRDVLIAIQDLVTTLIDAEDNQRAFLLNGEEIYRSRCEAAAGHVSTYVIALRRLTADNPKQQANLDRLSSAVAARTRRMQELLRVRATPSFKPSDTSQLMRAGSAMMDNIRQICSEMRTEEERLLVDRTLKSQRMRTQLAIWFIAAILITPGFCTCRVA